MKTTLRNLVVGGLVLYALVGGGPPCALGQGAEKKGPALPTAEAARLQVILLGYTRKDGVGRACRKDILAMKKMLLAAFDHPQRSHRLLIHDLTGDLWSSQRVLEYIQKMPVQRTDVVLVYHSGHGGDMVPGQPEESHILNVNIGGIPRTRLRKVLWAKQPQGLVLLTDCCSTYHKRMRSVSFEEADLPRPQPNWATLRNLLLRTPRLVNLTAAEDGRLAQARHVAHKGTGAESAFTVALLTLLHSHHEFGSWGELFPYLKKFTREAAGGRHQPRAFQMMETNLPSVQRLARATLTNRPTPDSARLNTLARPTVPLFFPPGAISPMPNRPTPDPQRFNTLR